MDSQDVLLVLHILFAAVLIGPLVAHALALPGLIGRGPEALPVLEWTEKRADLLGKTNAVVFVLGVFLVLNAREEWSFDQTWIGLSMALFIVASLIGAVGIGGAGKKAIERLRQGEPVADLASRARVLGLVNTALFVAIIALMVTKPGQ